jgi:hypothetical protein
MCAYPDGDSVAYASTMRLLLIATACVLMSCSSSSNDAPIASTPLAGTIGGRSFTAKSARARKSVSNAKKKSITIYDADTTCASTPSTDRWISATPIWEVGATQDPYEVAWYVGGTAGGTGTIYIAESAKIEVVEAPTTVGSAGIIRIRASNKGDSIEGQISVQICE